MEIGCQPRSFHQLQFLSWGVGGACPESLPASWDKAAGSCRELG
jgi:hypothetical protein